MAKLPARVESFTDLQFPSRGVDLTQEYVSQLAGTTPIGTNVRLYDSLAMRARGGSRSGLSKYIPAQVNGASASKIQCLDTIAIIDTDAIETGGGFQRAPHARKTFWSRRNAGILGVQKKIASGGPGVGPFTLAFDDPITSGNSVVVIVRMFSTPTDQGNSVSVSDARCPAFTQVGGYVGDGATTGGVGQICMWRGVAGSSGANTVSVQPAGPDTAWWLTMALLEYSGMSVQAPASGHNDDGGTPAIPDDNLNTGSVSVTSARSRVLAVFGAATASSGELSVPTSCTLELFDDGGGNTPLHVFDGTFGSGIVDCVTNYSGVGGQWEALIAAFKPA